jgi:formate dehydrogenase iron-sulfur subunit
VIGFNENSGVVQKCTLCYDRLQGGMEPACAKACPTESIMFGTVEELRATARRRVDTLHSQGVSQARLYGDDQSVYGGLNAFFLLMDEPEKYQLPNAENAVLPRRNNLGGYLGAAATAILAVLAGLFALRRRREPVAATPGGGGVVVDDDSTTPESAKPDAAEKPADEPPVSPAEPEAGEEK